MPRTLPSGIAANYTQGGSRPGYLLRMFLKTGDIVRITSLNTDYTLDGELYTATDVLVPDLASDGTASPGAQLVFGDMDILLWTLARQRAFQDAPIEIDAVYADAPDEAVPLFVGTCGAPKRSVDPRTGASFTMGLEAKAASQYAPRERVQYVIVNRWLLPPGEILIVNGQKWIIDRPQTSNS